MWDVSVAACYCAERGSRWKARTEQLHQQDIRAEAISLAEEKGWLISTLVFCSQCLSICDSLYSTVLGYGVMPVWVSARLNASPLSSGVWQGGADKIRMQWQPKGARLKLTELTGILPWKSVVGSQWALLLMSEILVILLRTVIIPLSTLVSAFLSSAQQ